MVAIATAAHYQAAALQENMPFPLLLDPEFAFRDAVQLRTKLSVRDLMKRQSGSNYLAAIRGGSRQGLAGPKHVRNRPAVLIADSDGHLRWGYEGQALGDYPPVADVLEALEAARA